jgi:hypothetical protein
MCHMQVANRTRSVRPCASDIGHLALIGSIMGEVRPKCLNGLRGRQWSFFCRTSWLAVRMCWGRYMRSGDTSIFEVEAMPLNV